MKIDADLLRESWRSWVGYDLRPPAGPGWLQWVWTLLFCVALAAGFTVLGFFAFARGEGAWRNLSGWVYWYGRNFIVCMTVGTVIHLMFSALRRWKALVAAVPRWPMWQRTGFFTGVSLTGLALGWPLGAWLAGPDALVWLSSREGNNLLAGSLLLSLMITYLLHHFFAAKARQYDAERRAAEARLRLLQAQIEPHFLFNTLANVAALIDDDAPKAKRMLESFTDYLRGSLGAMRADARTLGDELGLVEAYLSLLKTRMEDRLDFRIEPAPALRGVALPALVLQPLVENAVHHGLEPKVEGGRVTVSAHAEQHTLVLTVADDGLGLGATPRRRGGAGVALANLRERLQALYGSQASLTLEDAAPGTRAIVRLPLPEAA